MRKTLLLLIFLISSSSVLADAVCRDGWKSSSEGSGTCSWHGGVSQWYPDGTFENVDNTYNFNHRHEDIYLPDVSSLSAFEKILFENVANRQKNQDNLNEMIGAGLYSLTNGVLGNRTQAAINQDKTNVILAVQNNIKSAARSGNHQQFLDAIWMGVIQLRTIDPEGSKALLEMYSVFNSSAVLRFKGY